MGHRLSVKFNSPFMKATEANGFTHLFQHPTFTEEHTCQPSKSSTQEPIVGPGVVVLDEPEHMLKQSDLAGNQEAAFVVEPVLLGGSLQQGSEQRVTEIVVIDDVPPPLLSNIHHQASSGHVAGDPFGAFIVLRVRIGEVPVLRVVLVVMMRVTVPKSGSKASR
ncbi:hypothetical protein R1sor_004642 [Riccia sorocarpa]|uniref:Uncharacterized protein n=1 Tax=Riccia sorocarpa TaxID=122646 RepID=A0ABD3HJ88_9MARC